MKKLKKLFAHKKLLFVIAACVGIGLLSWRLFDASRLHLDGIDLKHLAIFGSLAVALQMMGHGLRAIKHHYLLQQIRPIRRREVFKGQMIGLLFNSIFPFRLGELVRAHYIGKGVSISRSAVFATIMFERLLDTIILAIVALLVLFSTRTLTPSLVSAFIVMGVVALLLATLLHAGRSQRTWLLRGTYRFSLLFNDIIRDRVRMMVWSGIYCLKNVINGSRMPLYLLMTMVMWICYITSAFVLIISLTSAVPFTRQLIASVAAYFGVSIPSGPAYIDTFQRLFSEISALPETLQQTTHLPFILWGLLIIPTTLLGLYFLGLRQKFFHAESRDALDVFRNKLYRDADISKEFSHFLDAYFRGDQLNRILTSQELASNFQVLKMFKGGSNALTLLAWQDKQMVVKKITLKQYEEKLRAQYLWLKERSHLKQIAKALAEHRDSEHYSIDIAYNESYVTFFDFIHSSSVAKSQEVLHKVCDFADKHMYTPRQAVKQPRRILKQYIQSKAVGKVTDAANANLPIANLLGYDTLMVNGREIKNFSAIIEEIAASKQAMADLSDIIDCPIQGDLTVDNIIVNPADDKFVILDPNNENAISDPVVDYGKLMQSVHSGYEFLYHLPSCSINKNYVNFEERRSVQYERLYHSLSEYLQKQLTPGRYRAVLFHEAIHYCRMLTYRAAINPDTAAAFYCVAVRLLNDFMEQYKDIGDEGKS